MLSVEDDTYSKTLSLGECSTMNTIEIYRHLIEINARAVHRAVLENDILFERARSSGLMSLLLEQEGAVEFTDEDANKLQSAVDAINAEIKKNEAWIKGADLGKEIGQLQTLLPDVSEIATLAATGKAEELQKKVQDLSSRLNTMVLNLSSMQNVMVSLGKNLKPIFDQLSDESKKETISALTEKSKSGGGKIDGAGGKKLSFPTPDDLKSAIEKAFTPTDGVKGAIQAGVQAGKDESGGFFSKVVGFFKNLFSKPAAEDTRIRDALVQNVMEMTPEQLKDAAAAAATAAVSLESAALEGSEAGTEASSGAAAAVEKATAVSEKRPIGKEAWTALAKSDPERFKNQVNSRAREFGATADILESRWTQLAGLKETKRR
jgi:hypothetical protein